MILRTAALCFLFWHSEASAWEKYRIAASSTVEVDQLGICRNVVNGKSKDILVPTKTTTEFNAFNSNPSASVTSTACSAACGEIRSATVASAPQHSNIVLYTKLNGSGSIANNAAVETSIPGLSVTANNGDSSGMTYSTGRIGTAIQFDGNDDGITFPPREGIDNLSTMSIAMWLNLTSSAGTLLYKGDGNNSAGWWMDVGSSYGKLGFVVVHSSVNIRRYTDNVPALSTWFHLVVTWDGTVNATGVKIYINGAEVPAYTTSTSADGSHTTDAPYELFLGIDKPGSQPPNYQGKLDHLAIWNSTLTSGQVSALYAHQNACP